MQYEALVKQLVNLEGKVAVVVSRPLEMPTEQEQGRGSRAPSAAWRTWSWRVRSSLLRR